MNETDAPNIPDTSNPSKSKASPEALDYSRRLYDNVLHWYENADNKAQIILGLDGVFVTLLTTSTFIKPADLGEILGRFTLTTWLLLGFMAACVAGSIIAALVCLWSRIYSPEELQELVSETGKRKAASEICSPEVMWFFQMVGGIDPRLFREQLAKLDANYEVNVLSSQIHLLSQNVTRKHKWVNRGFVLAVATLMFFLTAGINYVVMVSRLPA